MAIVKHIKSRNANYSTAINYLLFEHDEKTGKKIVYGYGRNESDKISKRLSMGKRFSGLSD